MTKVAIIGGGIAGTVAAVALLEAGIEATVYEAYERDALGRGSFLTLAVNGLDALRAVRLDRAVRDRGHPTPRMALFDHRFRRLAEIGTSGVLTRGSGSITLRRSDLYEALRGEALRRNVPIVHGRRLLDIEQLPGGVRARFAGGDTAEADLLVGADGLRSRVRQIIDPYAPAPRYVPLLNASGYARGLNLPGERGVMHMIFGRRCFFCYVSVGDDQVWWFANPPQPTELDAAALAAVGRENWRARLDDLLTGDAGPAREIVRATERIDYGWNTYDLPPVRRWHRNRMIIIGDAAHAATPSSGQGASLAAEDAVVLAQCLRDLLPDVSAAFGAYERLRRRRVERVVAQGRRSSGTKTAGPVGRALRDLALRAFARFGADGRALAWQYDHHIDWDCRVTAAGQSR